MLSKNKTRFIVSLQKKKIREEQKLYIIEGDKLVKEFLNTDMPVVTLIAKPEFLRSLPAELTAGIKEIVTASYEELKHISALKTPHNALAVVSMPDRKFNSEEIIKELCVALDLIQDPGNLGTIIRAAAWFGIKNIVCSEDCADVYNPKVVQASMGAIMHTNVYYINLRDFIKTAFENLVPVYGTLLVGKPIYNYNLGKYGIILLGNESRGISDELMPFITDKIMIPKSGNEVLGIDSLNVGMAAAIVFSEFARRKQTSK